MTEEQRRNLETALASTMRFYLETGEERYKLIVEKNQTDVKFRQRVNCIVPAKLQ